MPAFEALQHYHPLPVLLIGLVTFASLLGAGVGALGRLRIGLPGPWREVVAVLGSLLTLSLCVQLLGWARVASRLSLQILWAVLVLAGLPLFWRHVRRSVRRAPPLAGARLPLAIGALALLLDLLLAVAPSTKHDELHYHMLVPDRIVADGGLVFYRQPWLAAVLPQMHFQIASAPLHALGFPDAPNVVSWCLGLLLAGFVAALLYGRTRHLPWSVLCAAAVPVGLYASVWHTTGGSHAMGDLATAGAAGAILLRRDLLRSVSAAAFAGLVSTLVVAAASAKVSILPLGLLILTLGVLPVLRESRSRGRVVAATLLPWLVFYLPLAAWTHLHSGSPFGPLLRDVLGRSVYGEDIARQIRQTRIGNQVGAGPALRMLGVSVSPLIWGGVLAFFVLPGVGRGRKLVGGALLAFQLLLTATLLPHDFRFLGGLQYALFLVAAIEVFPLLRGPLDRRVLAPAVTVAVLLPWLAVAGFRAYGMLPVSLGLEDPQRFCERYVGLYDDFRRLDAVLPREAVLVTTFRVPSVYSPRPIFLDPHDVPPGRPRYLLTVDLGASFPSEPAPIDAGPPGALVYENDEAPVFRYRTPGRAPTTGRLEVRAMTP